MCTVPSQYTQHDHKQQVQTVHRSDPAREERDGETDRDGERDRQRHTHTDRKNDNVFRCNIFC